MVIGDDVREKQDRYDERHPDGIQRPRYMRIARKWIHGGSGTSSRWLASTARAADRARGGAAPISR
jgi:hypothetical protein